MTCFKCNGKGKIRGFEHVADGTCFQCEGTGKLMTRAERLALRRINEQKAIDRHDARVAKMCGLSVEAFREIARCKS